jgi:molecular chaperone GrpE (heat shock protein)
VKKLLPFVEDLRKSLQTLSEEDKNSAMWKWVQMVYDRFIKALGEFSVFPIPSLHETPDTMFHEPIWAQPTEDKKLKWKIIQVFEQWFYYQKENWDKITIFPSKVIIGQ